MNNNPQIPVIKDVFGKNTFNNVIDRNFHQLIKPQQEVEPIIFTTEDFFRYYAELFYDIPKEGDSASHRYLINKSSEYLEISNTEIDIQLLLDEIGTLKEQLLASNEALAALK